MRGLLACALLASVALPTWAGECGTPGRDGSGTISGTVNAYWAGQSNPSAGATSFSLGVASGAATPIAAGDLLLLFQTQDANINRNNSGAYGDGVAGDPAHGLTQVRRAGRFEFVRAANTVSLAGGTLNVTSPVVYDYSSQPATATRGQRSFQIIRVPQYLDATVSGTVTAAPWNGQQGGIVVMDVANTLTFASGTIDVSGIGFRGGGARASSTGNGTNTDYRTPFTNGANGAKGEGVAGTPRLTWTGSGVVDSGVDGYPNGDFARGAPGNGGGGGTDGNPSANDQNTGGGGGAGWGSGGQGGHGWCPGGPSACSQTGGFGGAGFAGQGVSRLSLGGGGGAGTTNNATGNLPSGQSSSGVDGGGVVILRAGTLTGSGTIRADGEDAPTDVDNDGSGGGGGGGAVLLSAQESAGLGLSVSVQGGDGGTNGNSSPHGPGGGGGGGFVGRTSGVTGVSASISPGQPGTTEGNASPFNQSYGAEPGQSGNEGTVSPSNIPGFSSGEECRVDISKSFDPVITTPNSPVRLRVELANPNPTLPMASLAVTDPLPSGVSVAPVPNASTDCGGSVSAVAGATSVSLSGASLASGASCAVEVDVLANAAGTYDNIIPVGNAVATINGADVANTLIAEDSLSVPVPLIGSKTVSPVATPDNPDAFYIPGATVEYRIAFENPSGTGGPVSDIDLRDVLPEEVSFLNSDVDGPGSGAVVFDDGSPSTTLSAAFAFSNNGGASYGYTPAAGVDANVDALRFAPGGSMPAGTSGAIRFRAVVK